MSKPERHVSESVEMDSLESVDLRYTSPSGGHFAVLQMLHGYEPIDTLELLILEATGETADEVNIYRRGGALAL